MALQIAQWNLNFNAIGFPANRAASIEGSNSSLILPIDKNVLIKKISLDCVYNTQGNIVILDFDLFFELLNINNISTRSNSPLVTSGFISNNLFSININKSNPIINFNEYGNGILFTNYSTVRNKIILNNTANPITSNISFLISIYYVK